MYVTGLIQESNPDRLASLSSTATLAYLRRIERLAGRGEARRGSVCGLSYAMQKHWMKKGPRSRIETMKLLCNRSVSSKKRAIALFPRVSLG